MTQQAHWETDREHYSEKIKAAPPCDGGWVLEFEDGGCLLCTDSECKEAPQPGETARLFGKGFGYVVRGIVISGRVYRYRDPFEEEKSRQAALVAQVERKQRELDSTRADRDARRAALPEVFRTRLAGFEAHNPDWRREFESYELFVCEEAVKIAAELPSADAIKAFRDLTCEEQKLIVPGLAYGEHSGNTFGAACSMAHRFLRDPATVPAEHGAICPLLGCQEVGCHAARG